MFRPPDRPRRRQHALVPTGLGPEDPVVSGPVVGASKPRQLNDAVAALDLRLYDDEIRSLEAPYTSRVLTWF